MNIDASFWTGLGFAVFIIATAKPLWKTVRLTLDERRAKIASDINEAAQLHTEARSFLDACKQEQSQAFAHAQEIIQHAQEEAERLKNQAMKETQQFQANEERLLLERMRQAEEQTLKEIQLKAVELALGSARTIIADALTTRKHDQLYHNVLQELEQDNRSLGSIKALI